MPFKFQVIHFIDEKLYHHSPKVKGVIFRLTHGFIGSIVRGMDKEKK